MITPDNVVGISEAEPNNKKTKRFKSNSDTNAAVEEMNKRYAVVKIGSSVRIADTENEPLTLMSRYDFLTYAGNNFVKVETEEDEGDKPKRVNIAKLWLEHSRRRSYKQVLFHPSKVGLPPDTLNLWKGWGVEPKKDAGKYDLFLDHIYNNICNSSDEVYLWVMNWLCDLFQNPMKKIGVALVLRSPEEGTGKGFFVNKIGRLLGKHFDTYLHSERIIGKFNAHLKDKLLIFMDEAVWAGDKQARGVLYGLITEPTITIEAKGLTPEQTPSYLRVIMASNHDWVAPAGPTARRFCVLDVAEHARNNTTYFKEIEDELAIGGYEALLYYFLNTPYNREMVRHPLKTDALLDQKIAGMENETSWFFEVLNYKKFPGAKQEGDIYPWTSLLSCAVETDFFYTSYYEWSKRNLIKKPCNRSTLARMVNKNCGLTKAGIPLVSHWRGEGLRNQYMLAPIQQYRDAFENKFGQSIKWEE